MPYIKKNCRVDIDTALDRMPEFYGSFECLESGELNYLITKILLSTKPKRYEDYNKLVGVLECVKLELYRKRISKYEDKKCEENGEVY